MQSPFRSRNQLKIPSDAKAKYDEASQLMAKADYAGAVERLNQAVAIYPEVCRGLQQPGCRLHAPKEME